MRVSSGVSSALLSEVLDEKECVVFCVNESLKFEDEFFKKSQKKKTVDDDQTVEKIMRRPQFFGVIKSTFN